MASGREDERIGWSAIGLAFLLATLCAGLLYVAARTFRKPDARHDGAVAAVPDQVDTGWHPAARRAPRWWHRDLQPPAGAPNLPPRDVPDEYDPQLARSNELAGALDGGVGFGRWDGEGHVTSVSGDSPVSVGASCDVRVLPVLAGGFNCLIRVMCGGRLLYPNPDQSAGYVACEVENDQARHAVDAMPTQNDTDPLVTFDASEHRVLVADFGEGVRAFSAQITLDPPVLFINRTTHAAAWPVVE